MTLSDLASIGSFVSGVAVLISLLFFYFQLRQLNEQVRQSDRNQQALIRQGKTDRIVEILLKGTERSFAEALSKVSAGYEDSSATQLIQYQAYMSAHFANFEDIFYQHKDGLLTDVAFLAPEHGLTSILTSSSARQFWKATKVMYPPEFVTWVDSHIDTGQVAQRPTSSPES